MIKETAFFLELPCIVYIKTISFLVWDVFSDGRWREKHVSPRCPVIGPYISRICYLESRLREKDAECQREIAAFQQKHQKELDAVGRSAWHPGR